ncbi:nucleotidyltransferase [Myxococcus sp. K38C18041901]|uniref:nucleotidyltransferase domain-containing protein n=1 Tax=Myxococcus guangdongensis TaxID=2906760 RepID=UPI0020A71883|nr:nucleotidyltransferase [Myxococcus guangdongensis]MCP3062632.1 nucleotidyltransferase [Myxococcus guangdongensis]
MWTVEQAMQQLVEELELTADEDKNVKRQHGVVREVLRRRLFSVEEFLSGSYSRGTALRPLHDVDVFVVARPPRGSRTPDDLLREVRQVFKAEWSDRALPVLQRHSLRIDFSSGISVDIVPAFAHEQGGYLIPQRDTGAWIRTDPKAHQEVCAQADRLAQGRLNPLIKLVKQWNRARDNSPLRSFHLEAMCYSAFQSPPEGSYLERLEVLFQHLSERVMQTCRDPAKLGVAVDERMALGHREAARNLFQNAIREVLLAFQERTSNPDLAHQRLSKLFGPVYRKRAP